MRRTPRRANPLPLAVPLAAALLVASVPGCGTPPLPIEYLPAVAQDGRSNEVDGLRRVRSRRVGALFLRPGARLVEYHGVVVDPIPVAQTAPSVRRYGPARVREHRGLGPEGVERLQRILRGSLEHELADSAGFELAPGPGPGVLRISASVLDLVWEVTPREGGEDRVMLRTGVMTLVVEVRDAVSGELLLRLADRREIRPTGSGSSVAAKDDAVRNWSNVRDLSALWSRELRNTLEALHALPEVPLPDGPVRG